MAEVQHKTTTSQPIEQIWEFVKEIDNWAPMVAGYVSHEKENADDSSWVLKGDLGSVTRTLKFKVHVSEWAGPDRVTFELVGINEQMEGNGVFQMSRLAAGSDASSTEVAKPARPGLFQRLRDAIVRFFLYRVMGRPQAPAAPPESDGDTDSAPHQAELSFSLEIRPGGPMGPMINAMVKPALTVAAEDLARQIVARVESDNAGDGRPAGR